MVLNTNKNATIVSEMDMIAKIRKKVSIENVAISFSPTRDLFSGSDRFRMLSELVLLIET